MEDANAPEKLLAKPQRRLDSWQPQTRQPAKLTDSESLEKTILQDHEERLRHLEEVMRRAS